MFSHWFKKKTIKRLYKTPHNETAYVIGDVHGCLDELLLLLNQITEHAKVNASKGYKLVFLGDLIDRGPKSNEVIEYLRTLKIEGATKIFLMGNHEEVFLKVIKGNIDALRAWLEFGGKSCLRSYSVDNLGQIDISPEHLLARIQLKVPKSHIDFIEKFQDLHVFGDYLFVHAGIRPQRKLKDQNTKDLRWIRKGFLDYDKPHAFKIVHGHTVVEEATDYGNRIAIDTGTFNGGPLTALYLQAEKYEFLTTA